MLHVLSCNHQAVNATVEITDPTHSTLITSILHGDYTIGEDATPSRHGLTGTWVRAAYTIAGQDKVEVNRPVFRKDGQATNALMVLHDLIQEMCQPVGTSF